MRRWLPILVLIGPLAATPSARALPALPALGPVGDERIGVRGTSSNTLPPLPFGAGAFRRGVYLVELVLVSPPKTFPLTHLAALAKLVDMRIRYR